MTAIIDPTPPWMLLDVRWGPDWHGSGSRLHVGRNCARKLGLQV